MAIGVVKLTVGTTLNTEMEDHLGFSKNNPDGRNTAAKVGENKLLLSFLSLLGMLIFFLFGYQYYRKAGWVIVAIMPILAPTNFTFVPSNLLPLTMTRVAFAVTLGMILKNYHRKEIPLRGILRSSFVKILCLFSLFVVVISIHDRFENIFFTYIPRLVVGLALCYIIIRDRKDLNRLVTIFVLQAALISVFILLEYFTSINVMVWLRKTIPGVDLYSLQTKGYNEIVRAGFLRASGIDGNSVPTGYRLVFLFPIVLWFAYKKKIVGIILIGILASAFILLQTRAAFVGAAASMFALIMSFFLLRDVCLIRQIKIIGNLVVPYFIILIILLFFFPQIINPFKNFYNQSLLPVFISRGDTVSAKIDRLPRALNYIKKEPLKGYGSPHYAYFFVMETDDVPSPVIYAIAGGIPLVTLYLAMIFYMPYSIFKLSRMPGLNTKDRVFLCFAFASFVGGITVVFSNWQEKHFMIMYMLYISIYKVYSYKRKSGNRILGLSMDKNKSKRR